MNPQFPRFEQLVTNPFRFALFKLVKLPASFVAGLRVEKLNAAEAVILVKHGWLNQNPFRSMYFAVQAMAAEMSTGLFAVGQTYQRNPSVSMLVVNIEGKFFRKATGTIAFTCKDGALVDQTIEACIADGEGRTLQCRSIGTNEQGEVVSEFVITWSFKAKKV
ncbi:MAG: DUF4442 domain-containing protein [Sphingobacteriia bacterium]|nr:DUF4442 domain-containing protein [Sphingobacteriia bacterium]